MKKKSQPKTKLFIVRKYVWATSVKDAIKKERTADVDDVWVDEGYKTAPPVNAIGFYHHESDSAESTDNRK